MVAIQWKISSISATGDLRRKEKGMYARAVQAAYVYV